MKRVGIFLGIAALVVAIVLQFASIRDVKEGDRTAKAQPIGLAKKLPTELTGWLGKDEPIGPNEAVAQAASRVLNFDDNVYRVFRRGDITLGVYVAYWAPGRMPIQKVASHTPDRCWTENGWHCLEQQHNIAVKSLQQKLTGAQWRVFEPPGAPGVREYTVYWHMVGERLYDYGNRFNSRPHPVDWWRDTVSYALSGVDEQFFVRLTSNRDFQQLEQDPGWQQLIASLARLGVGRKEMVDPPAR